MWARKKPPRMTCRVCCSPTLTCSVPHAVHVLRVPTPPHSAAWSAERQALGERRAASEARAEQAGAEAQRLGAALEARERDVQQLMGEMQVGRVGGVGGRG